VPLIVVSARCSKTGKVPISVGAAGTPVLPGDVKIVLPLCQRVSFWGRL